MHCGTVELETELTFWIGGVKTRHQFTTRENLVLSGWQLDSCILQSKPASCFQDGLSLPV
ncbi:hypothetical protein UK23_12530 [Lentzea aerocolonigenes]|uniref:Uncharacterized protein n=1 Tax=Lentzea aerocolonigenes TaxID=68170 RepID=A0A0F0H4N0_LENAE|nr:hypothetical protein UK23_12530 [Lentzea aerocolonigenes]